MFKKSNYVYYSMILFVPGSRDMSTLRFFQNLGVQSYFSGCLTLTLATPATKEDRCTQNQNLPPSAEGHKCSEIIAVDVPSEIMALFPENVQRAAVKLTHGLNWSSLKGGDRRNQRKLSLIHI